MPSVLAAVDDDARRVHLRECGRCQALQRMYETFLTPASHVPEAERRDAVTRLRSVLAAHMEAAPTPKPGLSLPRGGWFVWLRGNGRWALAAGVAAICVALVGRELRPGREEVRLREAAHDVGDNALVISVMRPTPEGGLRLEWKPVPNADAYEVRFYDADLREIAPRGTLKECALTLAPGDPALQASKGSVLARVIALRQAAPIAMSPLRPLPQD